VTAEAARAVADAVLYEGFILYPYRASAQKNRSRWQFGVLMPNGYAATALGESAQLRAECVLEVGDDTRVEVVLRFLQVQRREVRADRDGSYVDVERLDAGGQQWTTWDEAVEREFTVRAMVAELVEVGRHEHFLVTGGEETEPLLETDRIAGELTRRRQPLDADLELTASPVHGPWRAVRLRATLTNRTRLAAPPRHRADALPSALVAAHLILATERGAFVSMVDPPEWAQPAVDACANEGCWPVLAGPPGGRDVMLVSPIILYDHPESAPESPGDMFDATEIDEILTLRTLALTDEEKREARATDPRAAAVIDRVEAMDRPTLERLHGAIRYLRPVTGPPATDTPWWDPGADASVSPFTDAVEIAGVRVAHGSTVRLRPGSRRADAQDMFLAGRLATVEAVLLDVDNRPYLAVTLLDDPAADLQRSHGRYLYFAPDEVEAVS